MRVSDGCATMRGNCTWVNSSASQRAMSSEASGYMVSRQAHKEDGIAYARLVRAEEHQQRLQDHLDRVDILDIFAKAADEAAQGARGHRGRVGLCEAAQAKDGGAAILEQRCAQQTAAERLNGVGGRLLGRRLALEDAEHAELNGGSTRSSPAKGTAARMLAAHAAAGLQRRSGGQRQ